MGDLGIKDDFPEIDEDLRLISTLEDQIVRFEFISQPLPYLKADVPTPDRYFREAKENIPALQLDITQYSSGYFLSLNSNPAKPEYHRDTGNVIPLKEVEPRLIQFVGELEKLAKHS